MIVGVVGLAGARGARAQVSPGPLSKAHAQLEGNQNCLRCHGTGKGALDTQCLSCHTEIARLRDHGRGLHAREGKAACAGCHPEHAGRDFELIHWDPPIERFDHARAGFALEGKHALVPCRDCHRADKLGAAIRASSKRSDPALGWIGLETACRDCHKDPHDARLGLECASCHAPTGWHEVTTEGFDHAKTRFPLLGLHRAVPCAKCHDPAKPKALEFGSCGACHRDPHAGKATLAGQSVDCATCHELTGWKPSSITRARHGVYPLEGKHETVACAACHRHASAAFEFRPAHTVCRDCHADAHNGQLSGRADRGACESCHQIAGWPLLRFGAAEHESTRFPLEGAHEKASCAACHGPQRAGLPALPARDRLGSAGVLLSPIDPECVTCHADPHAGRFSASGERPTAGGCVACHTLNSFRPSLVDLDLHAKLGTPLEGSHLAVACDECHAELRSPRAARSLRLDPLAPLLQIARPGRCAECHRDPHQGQFATRAGGDDCATCHDSEAFRPATRFDHERDTSFSLKGAHAQVACARCHQPVDPSRGSLLVYHDTARECRACHADTTTTPRARP